MEYIFSLEINKYKILAIFWNVFLALIPCVIAYYMSRAAGGKKWVKLKTGYKIYFIPLFLFWLFMFPNTAYLFTIVRHLVDYCEDYDKYRVCAGQMWMVMFFFTYSLIGLPTFYYALKKMSVLFKKSFNKAVAAALPLIVIPLTSIGVMFGLFERFNSWDILVRPSIVFNATISYFSDTSLLTDFLVFTICLYLIYYAIDHLMQEKVKK